MDRRPILPLGRWAPWVLGAAALVLLVTGLVGDNRGMVIAGAVAAVGLLIAYPLAEFLLRGDQHDE